MGDDQKYRFRHVTFEIYLLNIQVDRFDRQ